MDAHFAYGQSAAEASSLRSFSGGQFKLNRDDILTKGPNGYLAGDFRVSQSPWLSLLHLIFYRSHNRCAENLAKLRPQWTDDKLFNETRRINTAMYQHFVFDEYIPLILGLFSVLQPTSIFTEKMK